MHFQAAQNAATQEAQRRFLASLKFDQANLRRNDITDAHKETFKWIFADSTEKPYDSFATWLQAEDGIYWISGKAGSGKSTLMKFILEHSDTIKLLSHWSAPQELLLLWFFFWNSGTPLQRNLKGLLCSLLRQLCLKHQHTIDLLTKDSKFLGKDTISDWSIGELSTTFSQYLQGVSQPVLILIDGLDEIEGLNSLAGLINFVNGLLHLKRVKLCVSGRREAILEAELALSRQLRLQDLTASDIRYYVTDFLRAIAKGSQMEKMDPETITDIICLKAEGVFLVCTPLITHNTIVRICLLS